MLASISGALIWIFLAGVVILIQWIADKAGKASGTPDSTDSTTSNRPPARSVRSDANSEEERMRKFLEALGLPPDQASGPSRQTPPPLRAPVRRSASRTAPVPPIVAAPGGRPPSAAKPRSQRPAPAPEQRPFEVERVHLPDLHIPEVPAFETVSSHISAVESGPRSEGKRSGDVQPAPLPSGVGEETLAMLRSPAALRAAFLAKEILGPPRSLQSHGLPPSFHLL